MTIRLLTADDHEVVRAGLRRLLLGTDTTVIAEAASGADAVRLARKMKPDVLVLDIRMTDGDGLEALARIREKAPTVRVLIFSLYDNPTYVARAVALGASGYLRKSADRETIIAAIGRVAEGKSAWSAADLQRVAGVTGKQRIQVTRDVALTDRESEVLRQLANGLTNKEIAMALGIGYETVKEHVQHILRKLDVADRTQAAVWAVRKGVV